MCIQMDLVLKIQRKKRVSLNSIEFKINQNRKTVKKYDINDALLLFQTISNGYKTKS